MLAALPEGASRVLDVGCGDGILLAELVDAGVAHVIGIDSDRDVLDRARARFQDLPIEWVHADVLRVDLAQQSFDAVVSIASLHHMDAAQALPRFAQLVRPGGVVVIVGLARADWWDLPLAALAMASRIGCLSSAAAGTLCSAVLASATDVPRDEGDERPAVARGSVSASLAGPLFTHLAQG